ncbi:MAG: radical SAM family heme chaperone HemW [Desulfomonile tiedjei]|uniref:Heme chaperone HemW n=1 Tax=Desulfomonile tiedjei TaxID=2358 RepID=A0A9D6V4J0_9BACT|nr:radical SAM family heme chaperone HemW [Desulfomonile tiedjei]
MNISPSFPEDDTSVGLYIHVPFCKARCSYCGFVSNIHSLDLEERYLRSVAAEIGLRAGDHMAGGAALSCDTIYFGGGTASLLPPDKVLRVIETCKTWFEISDHPEITIEINPGTVDRSCLSQFIHAGVNRVSLGVQSLVNAELAAMGRLHDSSQALSAYRDLRQAGFDNVSVDLIAGFPGQTVESVRHSLRLILELRPEHLSVYLLEIKSGTRLAAMMAAGAVPPQDEDMVADMYDEICEITVNAGYEQYEISNFAVPGRFSRHNMKYWTDQVYIGFGPGAHGMTGRHRYANMESLDLYEQALDKGFLPVETVTEMTPEMRFKDALIMGLRLVKGIDLDLIARRYGVDARAFVLETIGDLQSFGLFEIRKNTLRLTAKGRLLSNVVFGRWV